ncbi:DnaJ domain-containing protein [Maricaulaceae bacterium MS644]
MSIIFGLLAVLALLGALAYAFARADNRKAAQTLRIVLGVGGVVVGGLLTVRGLAIAGIPIITASLGFLGVAMRGGAKPGDGADRDGGARSRRSPGARPNRSMSRKEAAQILGVAEDADEATVRAAYRKLMKQVHPDAGGNDALASKVQDARDTLLESP